MDMFSSFFYMKECDVFSLESTHRGNSIALSRQFYSVHIIYDFQYKKNHLNYPTSAAMGCFPRD